MIKKLFLFCIYLELISIWDLLFIIIDNEEQRRVSARPFALSYYDGDLVGRGKAAPGFLVYIDLIPRIIHPPDITTQTGTC